MNLMASFLGGAKSRLLPASIPFRFFGAAVVFHVLFWLGLVTDAGSAVEFRGGLGPTLAAVHALTLGVLVTTSIGASVQLLPVATRRPLAIVWPLRLVFWLTVPGTTMLIGAMFTAHTALLTFASAIAAAGLLIYCGVLADNLRRARNLAVAAAYGWTALVAFAVVIVLGVALAFDDRFGVFVNHDRVALVHLILGGFGFMGLLAFGFSQILVPMFALSAAPPASASLPTLAIAVLAILIGVSGALVESSSALTIAVLIGLIAAAWHVRLMLQTLKNGMRKRLGLSFVLIRIAWLMLLATPVVGLGAIQGWAGPNAATLFAFFLLAGWLLTFLLGVLQRIMPFLASMHMARTDGAMPRMSELTASFPLRVHTLCHCLAIATIAVAIITGADWLLQIGSAIGLSGALAFAWFAANIIRCIAWKPSGLRAATNA